jgi:hypothetical protein
MELFRARATVRPGPRVLMKSASLAQAHQQLRAIVSGGVSLSGKQWDRSDDTIGIAGVINGIFSTHAAYFNGGGVGIVLSDGMLPHPWARTDYRDLLQLRSIFLNKAHLRLSVYRECRLQH